MHFDGDVMRGSGAINGSMQLESKLHTKTTQLGRPRRMWIVDILSWTGAYIYGKIKRAAEDRQKWKDSRDHLLKQQAGTMSAH